MISDCPECSSPILITAEDVDQITCPDCGFVFHPVRQDWVDPLHRPDDYVRSEEEIEADYLWEFGGKGIEQMDQYGPLTDLQRKDKDFKNKLEIEADKLLESVGYEVIINRRKSGDKYHKVGYKPRKKYAKRKVTSI